MTIDEMHVEFLIELDNISSLSVPNLTTSEIDSRLNKAIEEFVTQRYGGNNAKRTGVENTQERIDDLRTLVSNVLVRIEKDFYNIQLDGYIISESNFERYRNLLSIEFVYVGKNCKGKFPVRYVSHDKIAECLNSAFTSPATNEPIYTITDNFIEFYVGTEYNDEDIANILVTYLKNPRKVVHSSISKENYGVGISCDLPLHTHRQIVNMAVQYALENLESKRQQSFVQNIIKQE